MRTYDKLLEPEAVATTNQVLAVSTDASIPMAALAAQISMAISLKRIADVLQGDPNKLPPTEYLAECITNAIKEGLR